MTIWPRMAATWVWSSIGSSRPRGVERPCWKICGRCTREPELGLHPDLIPALAKLLRAASERMQLVVTTHSDALVDALTDIPEAVVVCEQVDGMTQCRRLDKKKLKEWLKKYSLGALWRSGELGGNRW